MTDLERKLAALVDGAHPSPPRHTVERLVRAAAALGMQEAAAIRCGCPGLCCWPFQQRAIRARAAELTNNRRDGAKGE